MLSSIFGSRNSHATKRHRSHSLSNVSKTSDRSKKAGQGDEEANAPVADRPDVEELRAKRQSYYSLSPAQRRQLAARSSTASKASNAKSSSHARSSVSKDGVRRRRKPAASRSVKSKHSISSARNSRPEDFVYGPTSQTDSKDGSDVLSGGREAVKDKATEENRHKDKSTTVKAASKRRSLPTVVETEVTPDDSISQVAERREERATTRLSNSRSSGRPSVKRSSTTSSRLQSVAESSEEHHRTATTSKRSSKRTSAIRPTPTPSRRHSTTDVPSSTKLVECLTCGSDDTPLPKSAELSCGHRMCHDCLQRVFEMSVKDPVHMPPKCCTDEHIPLKHVDKLFDTKFKMLWNRKYQEYHTKNRVYCPTPKCGEWIKPKHFHKNSEGRKYAVCPRCKVKVCVLCNNKMHKSSDCPKDPEIARLIEQAKEKGWQRCYDCNAMVELQSGCNHMTCRCGAQFCMPCGAKWKTCNCPWFNYSQIPNPDRLNDMRVPEPIRVIYRRVLDAAGGIPPPGAQARQVPPAAPPPEVTYQQELDDRRTQERTDAELARRLQLASLWGDDERPRRRDDGDATWGIGNAAGHHMNEDFVRNAADVVMGAFGDVAGFGRRGERSAGRRRRARQSGQQGEPEGEGDAGLAPGWLGDASVLGVGPATRGR